MSRDGGDAAALEAALEARLLDLQAATAAGAAAAAADRQAWYADAYGFLQLHGGEHWWCQHAAVTEGLAEVLRYHAQQPLVQAIWRQLAGQLCGCTECVNAHHAAQDGFAEHFRPESSGPLLAALHDLDCARLAAALGQVPALGEGQELPGEVVVALYEALTFDALLADAGVADALAGALCTLSARFDLALAEQGRYPGAYRLLAHPSADARSLAAGMVRTWGPVQDGAALEAVLPTLQHWVALLGGGELPGPGSASGRQPFQPPRAAVWRALHGLLPLLQGEAAAALLPQVPQLPEAVLGGLEAAAGPHTPQDAELCCWYAAGCWSHLLAAAGEDTFFHCAASPAAIVRQLAAAAGSSAGSERLHKAAAWAVAATLRHAAGSAAVDFEEAAATLRQGLLFLLHDIPDAAAAAAAPNQQHQKQPSPGRPRFSQLSVAVAEGAAFSTLLHLLQRGGNPAEAALRCAHFWLPPLAASLWHRGEGGSGSEPVATQHQQQRSPTLFAAADKAALQLAAAVLAGEVAALTAAAGAAAPDVPADAAVAAVAAVAAREGSSWHCLPALWSCLASASASHELSGLMLGAAADLCKLSSSSAASLGAAPAAFPVSAAAGFSAPGLASSLASDIAAAQRCLPLWQALRRRFLDEDSGAASPAAISVSRGPAYIAEQLQQAAAELLAQLTLRCRAGAAAAPAERHWAANPRHWQPQVALPLARLLRAPNVLLKASAEEFAMAAARQGSPAAAASVLLQLHPAAAAELQPLLDKRGSQKQKEPGRGGASANPFVRPAQASAAQRADGAAASRKPAAPAAAPAAAAPAVEVIDLTNSPLLEPEPAPPPRATATATARHGERVPRKPSPPEQQPEAPWFMQWPSRQQTAQPPAQQAQQAQQQSRQPERRQQPIQRQPSLERQPSRQHQQSIQRQRSVEQQQSRQPQLQHPQRQQSKPADEIDVDKLWPAEWPAAEPAAPPAAQRARQHAGSSRQPATAQQQQQQPQGRPPARQPSGSEVDVESLWPDKWPARKPSAVKPPGGPAAATGRGGVSKPSSGSRGSSPERSGSRQRARQEQECRPTSRGRSPEPRSRPAAAAAAAPGFRIPKRAAAAPAAAAAKVPSVPAPRPAGAEASAARPQPPAAVPLQPRAQPPQPVPPPPPLPPSRSERFLPEEDDSLFAGLPAVPALQQAQPLPRPAQPPAPPRRIVRLAAPPPTTSGGRRGARAASDAVAVPLWQQRRAALGAGRQQAPAATPLTMDALLEQLLSWDARGVLRGGAAAASGLQGLEVPVRFARLEQYTQVFSRLLLEECRAHLQQVLEESPAAVLCSSSPPNGSTSASGSSRRAEVAAALSDAGAEPLRLLEVQRQSQLHALRFEPAAAPAAAAAGQPGRQPETAAEFSRRCGIRADDLLLLVGRQAAAGAAPGSVSSAPPMALAAVDSVHQQQLPEGRQTQGAQGRARQLLLSARVSLAGGGAGMHAHFTAGTAWQAVRLMSLTPHLRQLQALVAAQRLPPLLLAELLSPATTAAASQRAPAQLAAVQPPLAPPLLAQLQGQYNRSQQVAIAAAAAGYRPAAVAPAAGASGSTRPAAASASQQVVLVQGPPGTGKTSAILGMLSVFLAANTPKCPAGASKPGGGGSSKPGAPPGSTAAQPPRRAPAVVNPTARVLLCAQSNAAVDELCMRLASRGVVGRDGAQRQVSVVRFGPLEALSPDAAVLHIDAAAAAMQTSDAGLGEASGQASQLASRLQALRQQLRQLQQQIDAADEAVEDSRERKRRLEARQQWREARRDKRRRTGRGAGGGSGAEGDPGSEGDSMELSTSDSSDDEAAGGGGAPPPSSQEVRQQLGPLLQRKHQLKKDAAAASAALRASSAAAAARRKELRAAVVAQSEVVAATLSSAGGELLQLMPRAGGAGGVGAGASAAPLLGFDAVVCDEAAQALEPSLLIALQLLAPGGRLVLVGDPQQLPATVLSRAAAAAALSQSLFERFMRAGYPLCMLRQQYRMHPAISAWPSAFFYEGRLRDAAAVRAPPGSGGGGRAAPWHARPRLPPLAFWDCRQGRERGGGGGASVSNAEEAEVAWALYSGLVAQYQRDVGAVAVLTPYKAQLGLLRRTFQLRGGSTAAEAVQFATVDGFQGREADVVIFSCVRAHAGGGASGGVGFLADVRRMNVGLTRARRSLWVIGHSATLAGCAPWAQLLAHCAGQGCLFEAAPPYRDLALRG